MFLKYLSEIMFRKRIVKIMLIGITAVDAVRKHTRESVTLTTEVPKIHLISGSVLTTSE